LQEVAEEDCEVVAPLSFVLVVLLRFDRQCARGSARGVGTVRWIPVLLVGAPKLTGTDSLDVRKGEVLVEASRSSRIWSYVVRRARLLEDLRLVRMTDRNTLSMVRASPFKKIVFVFIHSHP
jgi:hypothetical protein